MMSPLSRLLSSLLLSLHALDAYHLSLSPLSWPSARDYCHSICNSALATVQSQSDYEAIVRLIDDSPFIFTEVWIGLFHNSSSSRWQFSDGTPFQSTEISPLSLPLDSPLNVASSGFIAIEATKHNEWINREYSDRFHFACNHCSAPPPKYVALHGHAPFTAANARCRDLFGTELAALHSDTDLLQALRTCQGVTSGLSEGDGCWIGLDYDSSSGHVQWVDGTDRDYGEIVVEGECLQMDTHPLWSGAQCSAKSPAGFLCNAPSSICTASQWFAVSGNVGTLSLTTSPCAMHFDLSSDPLDIDGDDHHPHYGQSVAVIGDKMYSPDQGRLTAEMRFNAADIGHHGTIGLVFYVDATDCDTFYFVGVWPGPMESVIFIEHFSHGVWSPIASEPMPMALDDDSFYSLRVTLSEHIAMNRWAVDFDDTPIILSLHDTALDAMGGMKAFIGIRTVNTSLSVHSLYITGSASFVDDAAPFLTTCSAPSDHDNLHSVPMVPIPYLNAPPPTANPAGSDPLIPIESPSSNGSQHGGYWQSNGNANVFPEVDPVETHSDHHGGHSGSGSVSPSSASSTPSTARQLIWILGALGGTVMVGTVACYFGRGFVSGICSQNKHLSTRSESCYRTKRAPPSAVDLNPQPKQYLSPITESDYHSDDPTDSESGSSSSGGTDSDTDSSSMSSGSTAERVGSPGVLSLSDSSDDEKAANGEVDNPERLLMKSCPSYIVYHPDEASLDDIGNIKELKESMGSKAVKIPRASTEPQQSRSDRIHSNAAKMVELGRPRTWTESMKYSKSRKEKKQRIQIKISRPTRPRTPKLADPPLDEMYHDEEDDEKAEVERMEETVGSPATTVTTSSSRKADGHLRGDTVYHDFDIENRAMYILNPESDPAERRDGDMDHDRSSSQSARSRRGIGSGSVQSVHSGVTHSGHHGDNSNMTLTPSTGATLMSMGSSESEPSCLAPSRPDHDLSASALSPSLQPQRQSVSKASSRGPVLEIIPCDSHLIRTKTANVTLSGNGMEAVEEAFVVEDGPETLAMAMGNGSNGPGHGQYERSTTRDSSTSHFRRIGDSEQERMMMAPNDSTSEDSKYYSYGTGEDEEREEENEEVIFFDDDDDTEDIEPTTILGLDDEVDPDLDDDIADSEFERDDDDIDEMVLRQTTLATFVRSESTTTPRHERNFDQLSELQGVFVD